MRYIVHKHPLAIRWFHWLNFPLLAIMIWSGILIYWAYDPYAIKLFGTTVIKFFPEWFYHKYKINARLAEGMAYHFVFMWLFAINGFLYVLYTIVSGEWRYLLPQKHSWRDAWLVLLHDLHLRKTAPPQNKYNAAQRIAYSAVIIMGVGSLLTGLAIYKPAQFSWLTFVLGGYKTARLIHFTLTVGYCLFFIIHIVQVIIAGWQNFISMIRGFEVTDEQIVPIVSKKADDEK
ncbi:thiosulfate reductase [Mucilaginibacter robiniae]|uniref:Thiosulfate reductase n=1 Tax=Mucilaginibacter robiniae TaxID=2728022 RepID=A0A7L5DWM6_9SPHI|nr:cytochrome b/b6 domain-containing protein [Mucilaginibacter robiniae]QJD94477.1 thiosulfate reductase [Mucilaginibacter robiniae]